jgi:hypothetical protein
MSKGRNRDSTMKTGQNQLEESRRTLVNILNEACRTLGVTVVSPYVVSDEKGHKTTYPAFIPEFGSTRGTIVDVLDAPRTKRKVGPGGRGDESCAGRSYVNLASLRLDPLKNVAEMLEEWGYYGDAQSTPQFVKARS